MKCIVCDSSVSDKNIIELFKVVDLKDIYKRDLNLNVLGDRRDEEKVSVIRCPRCDIVYFNPIMSGDEKFYEDISKNEWYYPSEKFEFDLAAKFINKKQISVLEVGAGRGSFAKKLDKQVRYVGLEFNDNAVALAQKENISIYKKSIKDFLSENTERFNAVISFQVLEHVTSPNIFLKEKIELLNHGGYLIIAVPSDDSFCKTATNHTLDLPPHHLSRWSDKCLKQIAEVFNLDFLEIHHELLQEIHYGFFLTEKIKNILTRDFRYVRSDLFYKVITKISTISSRLLVPFFRSYLSKQRGAHVVVIYQKKINNS